MVNFANLLQNLIEELVVSHSNEQRIEVLDAMKILYSKEALQNMVAEKLNFNSDVARSVYLYSFFPIHATVVMKCLYSLSSNENCKQMLYQWYRQAKHLDGHVEMCALGGGPGIEMASAYLWLEELSRDISVLNQGLNQRQSRPTAKATVIDVNAGWESTFHRLFRAIQDSVCSPSFTDVKTKFIERDLMRSYDQTIGHMIGNSHLVVMMKFLSVVVNDKPLCIEMLKRIMNAMKPGALLIIIDGSCPPNKKMIKWALSYCSMKTIYEEDDTFLVNNNVYKNWMTSYGRYFGYNAPLGILHPCKIFMQVLQKPGRSNIAYEQHRRPVGVQHQRPVVQHQRSLVQHQRPVEQYQRPIVQHQRPIVQHQRPVEQYQRPIVQHQRPEVEQYQRPIVQHQSPFGVQQQRSVVQHQRSVVQHQRPVVQRQRPVEQEDTLSNCCCTIS